MSRDKSILVVDDEPNIRLVFLTALEAPGRSVLTAPDGRAALDRLAEGGYDVVLLDLQMPGMGGMEVLETLRQRGDDVPVIIVTAHGSIPDAVKAMRLGAVDFLSKPLTPDQIRGAVEDVLARHETQARPPDPVTTASAFSDVMARAKRSINRRAFGEAEVFLKQAIALDPTSAEALNLHGVSMECQGRFDEARREYKAALRADRRYAPAEHNLRRHTQWSVLGDTDIPIDTGGA